MEANSAANSAAVLRVPVRSRLHRPLTLAKGLALACAACVTRPKSSTCSSLFVYYHYTLLRGVSVCSFVFIGPLTEVVTFFSNLWPFKALPQFQLHPDVRSRPPRRQREPLQTDASSAGRGGVCSEAPSDHIARRSQGSNQQPLGWTTHSSS